MYEEPAACGSYGQDEGATPGGPATRQAGGSFVIAAVRPEAKVDQRGFSAACQRAMARLEEPEEE
jgi:hypothetical protein